MTAPQTVDQAGERALVERIRRRVPPAPAWVRVGIGDDAAVVEPPVRQLEVITTDALVEGVHFERRFATAGDLGFKALAVNLSDLAAMGATPRAAVLSLALPPDLRLDEFDALAEGLLGLAAAHRVALVGGNITRSPGPLVIDVTAFGAVHPRKVLGRGGARPGDEVYVSGSVGGARAGLAWLQGTLRGVPLDDSLADALRCLHRPEPRVGLGVLVGRNRAASACVDLSDGLADAVRQVAAASGAGVVIEAGMVPVHPVVAATALGADPLETALSGGEDYELLFTVPRRRRRAFEALVRRPGGPRVTRIGEVVSGTDVLLRRGTRDAEMPCGFNHFGAGQ